MTTSGLPLSLLHDHLDGGLRVSTILELAESIGWTLPSTDADELAGWFTAGAETGDLLQYLATFDHTLAVMQTEEHIERIAYEAAVDLADDGVVYAEVRFAPELHQQQGLPLDAVVRAVTDGFRRGEQAAAEQGNAVYVGAILCAMRTEQRSLEVAQLADRLRAEDDKVLGFDLAGAETGWPPSLHAEALQLARERHVNVTIHASEPPDLELIDDALVHGAHRIGHGVRLMSDMSIVDGEIEDMGPLAQYVLDHQIPLEMAPTCHVQIGAVPDLAHHPIATWLRAGFNVSVNTDNRLMSGVSVSSEVNKLRNTLGLTDDEVLQLVLNGINAGFAPYDVRRKISARTRQIHEAASN